jgi:hypothetical protein
MLPPQRQGGRDEIIQGSSREGETRHDAHEGQPRNLDLVENSATLRAVSNLITFGVRSAEQFRQHAGAAV